LLIGGVILGPIFSDVYRYCYPSQESVALSDLGVRVEDINKGSEERDRVQNQKLNEMLAIQGNEKAKNEYLSAHKDLINLLADRIVNESSDDLLQKQRESRKRIEMVSEEMANKYELEWAPISHFIIRLLDNGFQKWEEKGYLSKIESKDSPVVVSEKQLVSVNARRYIFKDGSFLQVRKQSGRVESGKLKSPFLIYLEFDRPGYPENSLLQFNFYADRTELMNASGVLDIENYKTAGNPMSDKEFIDRVTDAIPRVINHAIVTSDITL